MYIFQVTLTHISKNTVTQQRSTSINNSQALINLFFFTCPIALFALFCESTSPKLAENIVKECCWTSSLQLLYVVLIVDEFPQYLSDSTSIYHQPRTDISLLSLCNRLSPPLLLQFSLLLSKSWVRAWKLVKEPWHHQKFVYVLRSSWLCMCNLTSQWQAAWLYLATFDMVGSQTRLTFQSYFAFIMVNCILSLLKWLNLVCCPLLIIMPTDREAV